MKGSTFTLGGMAKGCGMIAPNMATMLAFLTTDADVTLDELQAILRDAADRTFTTLTVEGATTTNATLNLTATARAGWPARAECTGAVPRVGGDPTRQDARRGEHKNN